MDTNIPKSYTPTYFTRSEGTLWHRWPEDTTVSEEQLAAALQPDCLFGTVALRTSGIALSVHSLAWGDPIGTPRGGFARWDCINGWTCTLEEVAELTDGVKRV